MSCRHSAYFRARLLVLTKTTNLDSFVDLFRNTYISTRSRDYDHFLRCVYILWKDTEGSNIINMQDPFPIWSFLIYLWVTTLFKLLCVPHHINRILLGKLSRSGWYDLPRWQSRPETLLKRTRQNELEQHFMEGGHNGVFLKNHDVIYVKCVY